MFTPLRNIAHFDLDSFFVSVECLKNPALRGRPIAVGGHSDRGVVASCSYEARKFGVRSAMPARLAKRLCPELLMVKGDMDSYSQYSNMVTEIIAERVPMFEKASVDEFYIDLSGMDKFYGCALYTKELGVRIEKQSGLQISYALASNKLVSKVATNEAKPHGRIEVVGGRERDFLAPLKIEKMPMIGDKTAELLRRMGVETIRILSQIPPEMMINLLGKNGMELSRRANGIDETPIVPYHEQKSIGTENTFETDTIDTHFLHRELARMTEAIAFELRQHNKLTGCITVKIRYSDFQTLTKQCTVPYAASDHVLQAKARELFDKLYDRRLLVRLIGVRFSHLVPGNYQIHLFDDTQEDIRLHQSIDSIKQQYGEELLIRASGFVDDLKRKMNWKAEREEILAKNREETRKSEAEMARRRAKMRELEEWERVLGREDREKEGKGRKVLMGVEQMLGAEEMPGAGWGEMACAEWEEMPAIQVERALMAKADEKGQRAVKTGSKGTLPAKVPKALRFIKG